MCVYVLVASEGLNLVQKNWVAYKTVDFGMKTSTISKYRCL